MTQSYATDLTPAQIEFIRPLIPPAKPGGRPRTTDMIAVVNAIFYVTSTGCQWHMLPHDFPPSSTVYTYFNQWRKDGTLQRINEHLHMKLLLSCWRCNW